MPDDDYSNGGRAWSPWEMQRRIVMLENERRHLLTREVYELGNARLEEKVDALEERDRYRGRLALANFLLVVGGIITVAIGALITP